MHGELVEQLEILLSSHVPSIVVLSILNIIAEVFHPFINAFLLQSVHEALRH